MKKNIFVISTILLGIVVVLFTIATLQSENSDLHNMDRYYNNVIARSPATDVNK